MVLRYAVAIAYLLQKAPYAFPTVGGRKVEHLLANLEALEISLIDEQIQSLESEVEFDVGFPYCMLLLSILLCICLSPENHLTR